jgi:hypothetical protein
MCTTASPKSIRLLAGVNIMYAVAKLSIIVLEVAYCESAVLFTPRRVC